MKERPILFSAPMVRALLAGTKTQTRRVVKPQPPADKQRSAWYEPGIMGWAPPEIPSQHWHLVRCPYGQPGDRLWVREAWRVIDLADVFAPREITAAHRIWFEADGPHEPPAGRYRPGMFMPRWASRITLEVTGVRVERLQDISEKDAIAEGLIFDDKLPEWGCWYVDESAKRGTDYPVDAYRDLWESINSPGSWAANPWVWVVEFKRLEARHG